MALNPKTVVTWLSPLDAHATHQKIFSQRLEGTSDWILSHSTFQRWVTDQTPTSMLWAHGLSQTGMTICTAIVANHLSHNIAGPRDAVAWFFYNCQQKPVQTALDFLSSLCAQLAAQTVGQLPSLLQKLYGERGEVEERPLDIDEVMLVFMALCDSFETVYVCLDSVNECTERGERAIILQKLHWMCNRGVFIFVTSGTHGDVPERCGCHEDIDLAMRDAEEMVIEAVEDDIRKSTWARLRNTPGRIEALMAAGQVPDDVVEAVVADSGGWFLMAHSKLDRKVREAVALSQPKESLPEAKPLFLARALEDYTSQWVGGLSFRRNDIVEVTQIEHENSWKGRVRGKQGSFPRIRVERLDDEGLTVAGMELASRTRWAEGLKKIETRSSRRREFAMTTLGWVLHANATFTTQDLVVALSRDMSSIPTFKIWSKGDVVLIEGVDGEAIPEANGDAPTENAVSILDVCEGILAIGENFSLMLDGNWRPEEAELARLFPNFHIRMATACLVSLQLDLMDNPGPAAPTMGRPRIPFKTFAEESWGYHAARANTEPLNNLGLAYLKGYDGSRATWIEERRPFFRDPYSVLVTDDETPLLKAARFGLNDILEKLLREDLYGIDKMSYQRETPISVAVEAGLTKTVQLLHRFGASVQHKNEYGEGLLHTAASMNDEVMVALLIWCGLPPGTLSTGHRITTPLEKAVAGQCTDALRVLLDQGAEVTGGILNDAIKSGNLEAVKLLVEHSALLNGTESGWDSGMALFSAVESGSIPMVEYMLQKGARMSLLDNKRSSVFHKAAFGRDLAMIKYLVEHAEDAMIPYLEDDGANSVCDGRTAVESTMIGSKDPDMEIANYLIDRMPPGVPTKDILGTAATALRLDQVEMAKRLIAMAPDPLEHMRLTCRASLIGTAVAKNDEEVLTILLQRGMSANAKDKHGWSPLHVAAGNDSQDATELLIRHGADVNATTLRGLTPLHVAVHAGATSVLRVLLDHGANTSMRADDGSTPLVAAGCSKQHGVARVLVEHGVQLNEANTDGETILHYAVMDGDAELARILLQNGIDTSILSRRGGSALHYAAYKGNPDLVNLLVEHGAAVNLPHVFRGEGFKPPEAYGSEETILWNKIGVEGPDRPRSWGSLEPGWTSLHSAVCGGNVEVVDALLRNGADINARGGKGETPLHIAASAAHTALVQHLVVDHSASVSATASNQESVLHWAALATHFTAAKQQEDHFKCGCQMEKEAKHAHPDHRRVETIQGLISLGAEPAAEDADGLTPVARAVEAGHGDAVEALLSHSSPAAASPEAYIRLLYACQKRKASASALRAVSGMFENFPNFEATEETHYAWCQILRTACLELDEAMVDLALDRGASPRMWISPEDIRPFHHAIVSKEVGIVQALLEADVDVWAPDERGRNALHVVASHPGLTTLTVYHGDEKPMRIVNLLYDSGAEPNARTPDGDTALHFAVETGDERVVGALLRHGASVDVRNAKGRTPLHRAVSGWAFPGIVRMLLSQGASALATDLEGYMPLHLIKISTQEGVELVNLLVKSGADRMVPALRGDRPAHCAVRRGNWPVFRRLVEMGIDVHARGAKRRTLLHVAAKYGDLEGVEKLLGYGLKVDVVDVDGWTPVHHAVGAAKAAVMRALLQRAKEKGVDMTRLTAVVPFEKVMKDRELADVLVFWEELGLFGATSSAVETSELVDRTSISALA
ncbi:ankyrin repeat-containing domain protein [Immersiella caudata]|uniref:Ankyrin repeat-containing domain protein n=1 Tax=Immersiella caudata TaxID=314043 RepID=A0AA39WSK3_9PEZI|nr:ankyrin repeat-containing domain protein [Immersiella caudata]